MNNELSTLFEKNKQIEQKIEEIIRKRHEQIPVVEEKLLQLRNASSNIDNLRVLLDGIFNNNELSEDFKDSCRDINYKSLKEYYDKSVTALEHLKARFERRSINIGVTGHSQVGKSTLLQLISGLTNDQIPTGDGKPTTAARSRIFNVSSKDKEKALITFYSDEEFINIVLKPYFTELGPYFNELNKINQNNELHCPFSVEEFLRMKLPVELINGYYSDVKESFKNVKDIFGNTPNATKIKILKRLWEMQHDSSTWKDLLKQREIKVVSLNEVKKYIAYPSEKEVNLAKELNKNCERAYLAVKDAEIRCCFANANIQHLGIFDLPGLGEIVPKDAMFCIMQYDTELDLTVLITRPTKAYKDLTGYDSAALSNANDIRKPVKLSEDFSVIIFNKDSKLGLEKKEDIDSFINQILEINPKYKIFSGDITKKEDLHIILTNILEHLADRLCVMDNDYLENALVESNNFIAMCENTKKIIDSVLAKHNPQISDIDIDDEVGFRTTKMNIDFSNLLEKYKSKINNKGNTNNSILTIIEDLYNENEVWADNGLGKESQDKWIEDAKFKSKNPQGGKGGFLNSEFNRIRTKLRRGYSRLNETLTLKIEELYNDIANILKEYTGELFDSDSSGKKLIEQMIYYCENVDLSKTKGKKCETFLESFKDLLDIKFEYRCFYDADCFEDIEKLNPDSVDKIHLKQLTDIENYESIYNYIKDQFKSRNYNIKENLESNALKADWIIYNSLANFIDIFIFSEFSKKEFKYLCASFKSLVFANKEDKLKLEKIKKFECINRDLGTIVLALRNNGEK